MSHGDEKATDGFAQPPERRTSGVVDAGLVTSREPTPEGTGQYFELFPPAGDQLLEEPRIRCHGDNVPPLLGVFKDIVI
jgi:hypothetical protein